MKVNFKNTGTVYNISGGNSIFNIVAEDIKDKKIEVKKSENEIEKSHNQINQDSRDKSEKNKKIE